MSFTDSYFYDKMHYHTEIRAMQENVAHFNRRLRKESFI